MCTECRKAQRREGSILSGGGQAGVKGILGEYESELSFEGKMRFLWLDAEGGFSLRNSKDSYVANSMYIWGA